MMEENKRKSREARADITDVFGKIPPQATDLEEVILGAILIERDAISTARSILSPECFYKNAHQIIFSACLDIFSRHDPVDILTVTNELKQTGQLDSVGGPLFVAQLTNRVGSAANIEHHCRIVFEKYVQREIIRAFSLGVRDSFSDDKDPLQTLNDSQGVLDNLFRMIHRSGTKTWDAMVNETYGQIMKASESDDHLFGIPSGFKELDFFTSGRVGSDLIIIAARPGMGKTTRMLQEVINIAHYQRRPVGVFSLEMPFHQLIIKMVANQMEYNSNLIRSGKIDSGRKTDLADKMEYLKRTPIQLNDIAGLSILELKSIARMWKQKFGIEALYVDYLQLVRGDVVTRNREQEVSSVSRGLKQIAKDLQIPVIALSQLSRSVESRGGDKRPQLSDLRESGAIEQDADIIEFLFRPDYYGIETDEAGNDLRGLIECIIAKNRNGRLGTSLLRFHQEYSHLHDVKKEPVMTTTSAPVVDYSAARGIGPNLSAGDEFDETPF